MAIGKYFLLLFVAVLISKSVSAATTDATGSVGVNYGRLANNLPPVDQVVQLLKSTSISKVKLFDSDPQVLQAFADSGIEIIIGMPDDLLYGVSHRPSQAYNWIQSNVLPFINRTRISCISVGNEVLLSSARSLPQKLTPAMINLHKALVRFKLDRKIKISSPLALNVLSLSYPPSAGVFRPELSSFMKPVLQFLNDTDSFLMINVYPYFAYRSDPKSIDLNYALFKSNPGFNDSKSKLHYSNLFDAQVDSVYAAMAAVGFSNVRLVIAETGWPSGGDPSEPDATLTNAAAYNGNLIKHVRSNKGTPLRPRLPIEVFIFALFNENLKTGPESEKHYGLFYPDKSVVYDVGVMNLASHHPLPSPSPSPVTPSPSPVTPSPISPSPAGSPSWCVAKQGLTPASLQTALDFACGQGKADCSMIQPGKACYFPNTLAAHSSFAFNNYYQKNGKQGSACDFGGAGTVTHSNPSYKGCAYTA